MVSLKLLLSYKGLPSYWESSTYDELKSAVRIKLEKVCNKITQKDGGGVVFISGDGALLLNGLRVDEKDTLNDFYGLNFRDYFNAKMDKNLQPIELTTKRFTFIYGVGTESALNKKFSGQLLRGLVEQCKEDDVWCFVCSDLPKTTLESDYEVTITNSLTLPNRVEEKLL